MKVDRNNPIERLMSYASGERTLSSAVKPPTETSISQLVTDWRARKPYNESPNYGREPLFTGSTNYTVSVPCYFNGTRIRARLKLLQMVYRLRIRLR